MKKVILLFALILLISCSSDDNNSNNTDDEIQLSLIVTVDNVSHDIATISWELQGHSGDVVYEVVVNGVEIIDDYSETQYDFIDIEPNTNYTGKVFAKPQNGTIVFDEFSFTTDYFDYYIESQEDVDNFNTTSINGTLFICCVSDISGLSEINTLGHLVIRGTSTLTSLHGLQNLTQFKNSTGSVTIEYNSGLTDVTALSNISSSIGGILIKDNTSLSNLNGLGLANGGGLQIRRTPIQNLEAFIGVEKMASINLRELYHLTSLNGLENLKAPHPWINIRQNPLLVDFCGLENLLVNYGPADSYTVYSNAYNPSQQDIIDGDCSL